MVRESCLCWRLIQTPSLKKISSCLSLINLSRCVRLDVFLFGDQASAQIPNLPSSHPRGCRRSSRSDKERTVVLIHMLLDGHCDSDLKFPVFLPAPEEGSYLVCTLVLEIAFILLCFAGRGWYVNLLHVDDWSINRGLDLYLRGCFNPFVLFFNFHITRLVRPPFYG